MLSISNNKQTLFLLTLSFFGFSSYPQNYFIENKGQMLETVIAKISIPSGVLYLENGKITYNFYSSFRVAVNMVKLIITMYIKKKLKL